MPYVLDHISGKMAKGVFEEMYATGMAPADMVQEKGLQVIADAGALEAIVEKVIAQHPQAVAEFRAGTAASKNFLVGQVMKETKGKADPKLVNDLLARKLASSPWPVVFRDFRLRQDPQDSIREPAEASRGPHTGAPCPKLLRAAEPLLGAGPSNRCR